MNVSGECNELGMTSQCGGNRECTLTPQGFGVCACPADTFGPPQCLGYVNFFPLKLVLLIRVLMEYQIVFFPFFLF